MSSQDRLPHCGEDHRSNGWCEGGVARGCVSTLKHLPIKQTTWFKDIIAESKILDTGVQGLNLGKRRSGHSVFEFNVQEREEG